MFEASINRWACPQGHFIAESSVNSEDYLDPTSYYGVSSRIWATCKVCGVVEEPQLVQIGTQVIELELA
jgi:hypothetical protein